MHLREMKKRGGTAEMRFAVLAVAFLAALRVTSGTARDERLFNEALQAVASRNLRPSVESLKGGDNPSTQWRLDETTPSSSSSSSSSSTLGWDRSCSPGTLCHRFKDIPSNVARVPSGCSAINFKYNYVLQHRPAIFEGMLDEWPATQGSWTKPSLLARLGDHRVVVRSHSGVSGTGDFKDNSGYGAVESDVVMTSTSLRDFIQSWQQPTDHSDHHDPSRDDGRGQPDEDGLIPASRRRKAASYVFEMAPHPDLLSKMIAGTCHPLFAFNTVCLFKNCCCLPCTKRWLQTLPHH